MTGTPDTHIITLPLRLANAYIVIGERPIIVDTGADGEAPQIIAAVEAAGFTPQDTALILHTHVHVDHAGSTAQLARLTGAPTAIHRADLPKAQRGDNGTLTPIKPEGHLFKNMVDNPYPPFVPDIFVEDGFNLAPYGVAGRVVTTPGHTAGSISVLLDSGEAIVGDVMMGGLMGGTFFKGVAGYHLFAEDVDAVHASLRRLIALAPHTFYVGHGGPVSLKAAARRFGKLTMQPAPTA